MRTRLFKGIGIGIVLAALALVGCGGDDPPVISGTADGTGLKDGIATYRAGLFGYTEDQQPVEVVSSDYITAATHAYTLVLDEKPSSDIRTEGSAKPAYKQLLIMAYNDKNQSGHYEPESDGDFISRATVQVAYFDNADSQFGAKKGYNLLASTSTLYTQDFENVPADEYYLSLSE